MTPLEPETPDEPTIIQYPNQLPEYAISALKSADNSIINKTLDEALHAQLVSPITKQTVQKNTEYISTDNSNPRVRVKERNP